MSEKSVAIVTGASRGIGRAIALELARLGHDILVNYNSNESAANEAKELIEANSVQCQILRGDISNADDRQKIIDFTREHFGRCDLLINNAGIAPSKRTDILEATEQSYDHVMNTNLKGPYFLTQAVANWMVTQQKDHPDRNYRIINITSVSSYASSPARGEYCLSKAGLSMMTKLYADRLAEYKIGVFEIRPGIIMTDMTSVVKDKYDKLIAQGLTPIKRWGLPEDVAQAVAAIAQGHMDFSTGQVINVDGGFHLQRL